MLWQLVWLSTDTSFYIIYSLGNFKASNWKKYQASVQNHCEISGTRLRTGVEQREARATVQVTLLSQPGEPSLLPLLKTTRWLARPRWCWPWMLLLGAAEPVSLATDCHHHGHQDEGSLFSESLVWSSTAGVSPCLWLAHDLCHSYKRGWNSKNLAILTAVLDMDLFPMKTRMVENLPNIDRGSGVGRPQFDHI